MKLPYTFTNYDVMASMMVIQFPSYDEIQMEMIHINEHCNNWNQS